MLDGWVQLIVAPNEQSRPVRTVERVTASAPIVLGTRSEEDQGLTDWCTSDVSPSHDQWYGMYRYGYNTSLQKRLHILDDKTMAGGVTSQRKQDCFLARLFHAQARVPLHR